MTLIEIDRDGHPMDLVCDLPPATSGVGAAYSRLYESAGFVKPWIGYFATNGATCVGTCGFKGPPINERVEIAYFTFPDYEGKGNASQMVRELISKAATADTTILVAAQTLPMESASTAILRKLGFRLTNTMIHPEDGEIWEWQLTELKSWV